MDAAAGVVAEFVSGCRELCALFSASRQLSGARHTARLAVRLVEQRRKHWREFLEAMLRALPGLRQLEVSDCNVAGEDLLALLQQQHRLEALSVYRCFAINRVDIATVLRSNVRSIALGTVTLSASALHPDEVIAGVHHLSLVNCKFVQHFHRNELLAAILRQQLPNLRVLTLGGAMNEKPESVSQTDYPELARLLVARHLGASTQKSPKAGDTRQDIVIEATYAHDSVVAFLREVGRELAARQHPVRFTFVDMSTDPLWALQALNKLPVVVKRAVFTAHPSQGRKSILHEAAITGDVERVRWLIDNGAVLDAKDAFGCTPLMRAVEHNNVEVVDLLLTKGANVWVTNVNREGPVFYAALRGYTGLLKRLLRHIETREGVTGPALAERLDTDCVDAKQFTPLHAAIIRQSEGCMRVLLDAGCSPHKVNSHGQQALHIATTVHFTAAVELLISIGVDVNSVDAMGMTPLDYARRYKHRAKRVNVLRASPPVRRAEDTEDSDETKEAQAEEEEAGVRSGSSLEELEIALEPDHDVPLQVPEPVPGAVDLEQLIEAAGGVAGRRPTGKRRHSRKHQRDRTQSR